MVKNHSLVKKWYTMGSPHRILWIVIVAATTAGLSVVTAVLVQKSELLHTIDDQIFLTVYNLPHPDFINMIIYPFDLWFLHWKGFTMPAYFYLYLGLFLGYMLLFKRDKFLFALGAIILTSFLGGWLLALDWHFVFRARPFTRLPTHLDKGLMAALSKWPSYPSGHVRDTTAYAMVMMYFVPRGKWLILSFCIFIAISRVYTGEHYPTDVVGGLFLGALVGLITLMIMTETQRLWSKIKKPLKTQK